MNKHTPGPWIAQKDPNSYSENDWVIGAVGQVAIDSVAVVDANNAQFIAAAPDMLQALIRARRVLAWASEQRPEFEAEYDLADYAIAKATGESA